MATFSASGIGTHAITAGTGALHVHVNTLPMLAGTGSANPANLYHVGFLRFGDGTGWWAAQPIDAEDAWIGVPAGTTTLGYSIGASGAITITEVAGAHPFSGPAGAAGATGATGATGAAGGVLAYALAEDQKTSGTAGGGTVTGQWIQRNLNTEVIDPGAIMSIASDRFTLIAGTYRIRAEGQCYLVNENKMRIYNVTDSTVVAEGMSTYAANSSAPQLAVVTGHAVIASSKTFAIEHRVSFARVTNGFGIPVGGGGSFTPAHETYLTVEVMKLA